MNKYLVVLENIVTHETKSGTCYANTAKQAELYCKIDGWLVVYSERIAK